MNYFDWFNCDTPLDKGFDEFCQHWRGKEGTKNELCNGGWSMYVPNDEWKLMQSERNNLIQDRKECLGDYGLMIDDNDFDYMCDYLLSKDAHIFMNYMDEKLEEKKCKLVGTPRERIAMMEQEFDD
ncbi:hypothetical protein Tco_0150452 [Tanacetum coccineum]